MGILTSQGYNLQTPGSGVGDIARGYQTGVGMQDLYRKNQIAGLEFGLRKDELGAQKEFMESGGIGQDDAINKAFAAGSKFQKEVATGMGWIDQRTGQIDQKKMDSAGRFAMSMQGASDDKRKILIERQIANITASDGDPVDTMDLRDMSREEIDEAMKMLTIASLSPKQRGEYFLQQQKASAPAKPMTKLELAKLANLKEETLTSQQKRIGGGGAVAFEGKGMPAQVSSALVRGADNPEYRNTAEYARAWDIANKPQIIDTEEGRIPLYPEINPIFKPPGPVKSEKEQVNNIKESVKKDVKIIEGTEKKKTTADEKLSAGFLNRMNLAEKSIKGLGNFDSANWWEKIKGITNVTASPELQQYRQAADDWIRSKLRRESGAVIAPEEMAKEYEIYFPQLGDNQPVIDQKKIARVEAINSMKIAAGRASTEKSSEPVNWSDLP